MNSVGIDYHKKYSVVTAPLARFEDQSRFHGQPPTISDLFPWPEQT
jgi:hypothetical protein